MDLHTTQDGRTMRSTEFPYTYLVAYQFNLPDGSIGFGDITLFQTNLMHPDDVKKNRESIGKGLLPGASVVILSWQLFEGWGD